MQQSELDGKKPRGGWRGGGRPKKFGKDIETTTISARIPVQYEGEARNILDKMVNEFAGRISTGKDSL
jgi:hypothetical protein